MRPWAPSSRLVKTREFKPPTAAACQDCRTTLSLSPFAKSCSGPSEGLCSCAAPARCNLETSARLQNCVQRASSATARFLCLVFLQRPPRLLRVPTLPAQSTGRRASSRAGQLRKSSCTTLRPKTLKLCMQSSVFYYKESVLAKNFFRIPSAKFSFRFHRQCGVCQQVWASKVLASPPGQVPIEDVVAKTDVLALTAIRPGGCLNVSSQVILEVRCRVQLQDVS